MAETSEARTRKPATLARVVFLVIPIDLLLRRQLEEDLSQIGCLSLIDRPWTIKSDELIQELIDGAPN